MSTTDTRAKLETRTTYELRKAYMEPGNGYRYDVVAVSVQGQLCVGILGSVTDGTLVVECFGGRAYLWSPNDVAGDFVDVGYVAEKYGLRGEHAHAVAAVIAVLLDRRSNSKFADKEVV